MKTRRPPRYEQSPQKVSPNDATMNRTLVCRDCDGHLDFELNWLRSIAYESKPGIVVLTATCLCKNRLRLVTFGDVGAPQNYPLGPPKPPRDPKSVWDEIRLTDANREATEPDTLPCQLCGNMPLADGWIICRECVDRENETVERRKQMGLPPMEMNHGPWRTGRCGNEGVDLGDDAYGVSPEPDKTP